MGLSDLIGIVAMGTGLVRSWPQAIAVLRSSDIRGVSALTWMLTLASAITWEVVGIMINKWVVAAPGLVMIPAGVLILWRIHRYRARMPFCI
ncbi:MAG: hypothetical protein ACREN8_01665 [Candidatus Dormibacteraceae bacterium]